MAKRGTLYIGNDHVIAVDGLRNADTGDYINTATVTATLKVSTTGEIIDGPIALSYQIGSNGNYRGTLPHDTPLELGVEYTMQYDAVGTLSARWIEKFRAAERRQDAA